VSAALDMRRSAAWLGASALVLLLLSACGGGSGPSEPVAEQDPTVMPDSAFDSPQSLVRYALSLLSSETAQPLKLGTRPSPTSETAAPLAL